MKTFAQYHTVPRFLTALNPSRILWYNMDFYILNCLSQSTGQFAQRHSQIWDLPPDRSYAEMLSQHQVVKQLIRGNRSARFCPSFRIQHGSLLRDQANVCRRHCHRLNPGQRTFSICLLNRAIPALQSCSAPRPQAEGTKRCTEEGGFGGNETGLILMLRMVLGCSLIWRR